MHTYIDTYMHACMHAYIHKYIHACMHAYIHTFIHTYIHTYVHICTYMQYTHIYIYTHMHGYVEPTRVGLRSKKLSQAWRDANPRKPVGGAGCAPGPAPAAPAWDSGPPALWGPGRAWLPLLWGPKGRRKHKDRSKHSI